MPKRPSSEMMDMLSLEVTTKICNDAMGFVSAVAKGFKTGGSEMPSEMFVELVRIHADVRTKIWRDMANDKTLTGAYGGSKVG